ncbi:MAG TPA: mechanosensitive ion channel family protein [Pyrinomonadaceae bacterium]|nr:mechanosensitive ion channel family protein [Pyrinomonadaceae bacterium]
MDTKRAEVEELKKDEDVRRALEQAGGSEKERERPRVESKHKLRLGIYFLGLVAAGAVYYLLRLKLVELPERYEALLLRVAVGAIAIVLALSVGAVVRAVFVERVENPAARFNLNRVVNLLVGLSIVFIAISMLFANWYTALVSFGIISLVIGFALQAPITSFIGWIYLLIKTPYRVGDRIKVGTAKGDVIDVSYLDTTIWEFGGEHLSTDHPSGRIIRFPNSTVLNTPVYNYSWSLFPYIWNDIKFQIAYQSDLEFVARVMREAAEEEVGEAMMERVRTYRELLLQTPVDELEVQERPVVVFRAGDNTWIEAIVRYLVEPRRAGAVKTRLVRKMLDRLNAEPDKAMFPKGDTR